MTRLVIYWSAKAGTRFRMIVDPRDGDHEIEYMLRDKLGAVCWAVAGSSTLTPTQALARALVVALSPVDVADRLDFIARNRGAGGRLWPENVLKGAHDTLEIEIEGTP